MPLTRRRSSPVEPDEVEVALEVALLVRDLVRQHVEVVGVEQEPDVLVGQEPRVRRVARLLEPVGLGRDDRVDEAELVDEEDPAARARHARELGDDELRAARVMEDAHAAGDVERAVLERQTRSRRRRVSSQFAGASSVAGGDELGREIDADDAPDERRERERERSRPAPAVERALGAGEGREQLLHAALAAPRRAPPGSPRDIRPRHSSTTSRSDRVARETIPQAIS